MIICIGVIRNKPSKYLINCRYSITEDEMTGWHHGLNGHEFEQTPEDSEGWGSLGCCSTWDCK